jgi:carbon monoxide dehydrogenase subunit G
MKLEFSGAPVVTASPQEVWQKLVDPDFVAASAPGVESVEALDPTHFKVISGLGV